MDTSDGQGVQQRDDISRPPHRMFRIVRRFERLFGTVLAWLEHRNIPMLRPWLRLARSREFWRFVRFLATGGVNFAFSYSVFLLVHFLGGSPDTAVITSWFLGVLFNFFTTGRIVFASHRLRLMPRFVGVYLGQLAANIVLLRALIAIDLSPPVAQALVIGGLAIVTFLALRRFVFAPHLIEPKLL